MQTPVQVLTFAYIALLGKCHCGIYDSFQQPIKNIPVSATRGEDVTFRCLSPSAGLFVDRSWTLTWIDRNLGGSSVIFGDSKRYFPDDRWLLLTNENSEYITKLKDVDVKDEGVYTCTTYGVNNKTSNVQQVMYLTVNVPPKFINVTGDLTVDEGDDVTLKCCAKGKPQPTIKWRHLIPSVDGIRATSEFLPLGSVTRGSGGKYECVADNGIQLPDKHTFRLTVNYPPEIDHNLQSALKVPLGVMTSINCDATAVPQPHFAWVLPNKRRIDADSSDRVYNVINSESDNTVRSTLILVPRSKSNFGNYTCLAANRLGSASSIVTLTQLLVPPTRPPPSQMFDRDAFARYKATKNDRGAATSFQSKHHFLIYFIPLTLHCLLCALVY